MSDSLTDLILSLTPEDGFSIGNGAMMALLREQVPGLSDDDYFVARDALVDDGLLAKGRGRGGSIMRVVDADEDEDDDGFELTPTDEPAPRQRAAARGKKAARKPNGPTQVLSYRHGETRVNNPEVGMVHAGTDPDGEKTVWAYDPHLDPVLNFDSARAGIERLVDDALTSDDPERMRDALQELKRLQAPYLNWTGKAERTSVEVDTVSLHVHERVDPATILANAAKRLKGKDAATQWRQPDLFAAPFENLPLRQALDFYHHEKGWSNRLVAGDSLLVMNSLLTKESMGGCVQMIYIDPPYGIKYGSNFQPFTNKRDVKDRSDDDLTQEPEMIKAFRDTWELGIHSYLTYLRDRLMLARELLTESGSVFVQISDENLHHVRELMDEIFGDENFLSNIAFVKTTGQTSELLSNITDYLVWYARDKSRVKFRRPLRPKIFGSDGTGEYTVVQHPDGSRRPMTKGERSGTTPVSNECRILRLDTATSQRPPGDFPVELNGITFRPGSGYWKTSEKGFQRLAKAKRISERTVGSTLCYVRYVDDFPAMAIGNLWGDMASGDNQTLQKLYVVQTLPKVVERCLLMTTDPGDLVLDPTCGAGTTAFVAEKWGRRWITCDTSRVAITLAKQRLMTASFDYYALRYPHEGLGGGFDYETVPHITLKSIANNPDIDTIYDEDHPKIAAALAELNAALSAAPPKPLKPAQGVRKGKPVDFAKGDTLHEWEVPFDLPEDWPDAARAPFDAFHAARQSMQRRMDQSIADHAEQETLYDKPRIDKSKLRICGPFSVEAVPAPTVLSLDESMPPQEADETVARSGETSRQALWRDELLKTGVRGKGGAMLRFAEFETLPGLRYLHASGSLAETGERVVVSFGPEHAALEQRQVELALTEAETLRPSPKFILFCAFTFDPEAAKDIDEVNWPGVTLLKAQMNTDLLTEDLKKKRASNQSFWLMGQPDVELRKRKDGLWEVEVNGFDYFDPKAGDLVSGGKTQIAMWSLDVDYDNRSLMPHQMFFPMADAKGGWNRLRKTVRAELDEDLLEQFHGTVSLPFDAGENRRIAVKIVDDRGIESLKIMPLER
ncbi:adenine-specific DNA-methyltransferase [Palleronia marisminoris]|uniref:site-specific DNA-methyltransferase (adenine-specific) n=1 Tax=Palleronia marisminoris TaxID=315423 RepID=A0A1Y5RXU1_9RHOB|nr:site-specific DNA-methyltransferase [Palleronia marisminoris]SFG41457.1 adenine-specific DNA-methyltransferase [Palleronia marisminoris]SLN28125.1 Modification methylase DpnIIB [Palleronia marisminoris]